MRRQKSGSESMSLLMNLEEKSESLWLQERISETGGTPMLRKLMPTVSGAA
jgi:hypothetical protein